MPNNALSSTKLCLLSPWIIRLFMAEVTQKLVVTHDIALLTHEDFKDFVAHVLCLKGEFSFSLRGEDFVLHQGEAMILGGYQDISHGKATEDLEIVCVWVRNDFLELCTPRSNYGIRGSFALYLSPIMEMDADRFAQLHDDFRVIERRVNSQQHHFHEDVLVTAVQTMFIDFFDVHMAQHGVANVSFQDAEIVSKFMEMLQRGDYVKHREVGHYADALCVTPKYLSEVLKEVSGRTANYWITRFATIHIRRLLQEKKMNFTQITELFDFSSPAYFSRFVQKNLGVSPSAFRE